MQLSKEMIAVINNLLVQGNMFQVGTCMESLFSLLIS